MGSRRIDASEGFKGTTDPRSPVVLGRMIVHNVGGEIIGDPMKWIETRVASGQDRVVQERIELRMLSPTRTPTVPGNAREPIDFRGGVAIGKVGNDLGMTSER